MPQSMTGFASATGEDGVYSWSWDVRSVNARGLDLRIRMPDWVEGIEEALRAAIKAQVARGNVTVGLRVSRRDDVARVALNPEGLAQALSLLQQISAEAEAQGVRVGPIAPSEIANMRGVVEQVSGAEEDTSALSAALKAQLPDLIQQFVASRTREGEALITVLRGQIAEISQLTQTAETLLAGRAEAQTQHLKDSLNRVLTATDEVDPERLTQELALIAVKTDVREELDRLAAHVDAAQALLASEKPMGRKLDFLMQEFNREANTLCSKAQFNALTAVGLDMKHVIDQMREQVQNVE